MKRNSIDMRIELLAAAKIAVEASERVIALVNGPTWGSAEMPEGYESALERLKQAVAQYDEIVSSPVCNRWPVSWFERLIIGKKLNEAEYAAYAAHYRSAGLAVDPELRESA
jgi:hypothetical protein